MFIQVTLDRDISAFHAININYIVRFFTTPQHLGVTFIRIIELDKDYNILVTETPEQLLQLIKEAKKCL